MGIRIPDWLRRLAPRRPAPADDEPLREFVYLDEISVYSILASRKGGIATEFTESRSSSIQEDLATSAGVGFGATAAKLEARAGTTEAETSQILSKAVIQTSFKELHDLEGNSLALRPVSSASPPRCDSAEDLLRLLESDRGEKWLLEPSALRRGALIEVNVRLEADPIFHMAAVVSTIRDVFKDNEHLLGTEFSAHFSQLESVASVLDGLLAGLVPIRGRAVDYELVSVCDRELLVHQRLLDRGLRNEVDSTRPVCLVGVAERGLFWKDIRRLLFSGAIYTTFGRVATDGLANRWHPVKVANVLNGIVPDFDSIVENFSEMARNVMISQPASEPVSAGEEPGARTVLAYARLLAEHHGSSLAPELAARLVDTVGPDSRWLSSVDQRRPVFRAVTRTVEQALEVECGVKPDERYKMRNAALIEAGLDAAFPSRTIGSTRSAERPAAGRAEAYLEAEIVGIYW